MRRSYGGLQSEIQRLVKDTSSTSLTFIQSQINSSTQWLQAYLKNYQVQRTQTASTVASQQYYHLPPDHIQPESITITIGSKIYPLKAIDSQEDWNERNAITFSGSAIPTYYFTRKDDFGIWPIPQDAYTITSTYPYRQMEMSASDYTTGTITVTENSTTITGSGTTFTTSMAGRWFQSSDMQWYRIASYSSTTVLLLESVYEGTTTAGATYTIGESPELPPEAHELIAYRVCSLYFGSVRRDPDMATYWSNMMWTEDPTNNSRDTEKATGGLLGLVKRYSQRSDSRIIKHKPQYNPNNWIWGVELSS